VRRGVDSRHVPHAMNSIQVAFFAAFALTAILTNVYWYRAKVLLRARGFPSSFITDHLSDFRYLAQVIATEENSQQRELFVRLRSKIKTSLIVSLALFGGFSLSSILSMFMKNH
jgi:hypothetical protein